jgi:hypothetical protein
MLDPAPQYAPRYAPVTPKHYRGAACGYTDEGRELNGR